MIERSPTYEATPAGQPGIGDLPSSAVRQVRLVEAAQLRRRLTAAFAADETTRLAAIRKIKAKGPQPAARQALAAASATSSHPARPSRCSPAPNSR